MPAYKSNNLNFEILQKWRAMVQMMVLQDKTSPAKHLRWVTNNSVLKMNLTRNHLKKFPRSLLQAHPLPKTH